MDTRKHLENTEAEIAESRKFKVEWLSFFPCFLDMFSLPESTRLRLPAVGEEGLLEDAKNIRGYFEKALGKF